MSTIVTVHGTNATGPAEGSKWWQRGSEFQKSLESLIASTSGELNFTPFIWDGRNSQTSRLQAGDRLLAELAALEAKKEPYVLIGHSHGGSVIAHALQSASRAQLSLPGMQRWITVGSPFIESVRRRFLFSRLGLLGKSILLLLFLKVFFWLANWTVWLKLPNYDLGSVLWQSLASLAPIPFVYAVLLRMQPNHLRTRGTRENQLLNQTYRGKWLAMWHPNDEAIRGLSSVRDFKPDVFADRFAVPTLSYVAVFLLPAFLLVRWIFWIADGQPKLTANASSGWINQIYAVYAYVPSNIISTFLHPGSIGTIPFSLIISIFTFVYQCLIVVLLLKLVEIGARGVSRLLSKFLNRLTWQQLQVLAFGADATGELAVNAHTRPTWLDTESRPLPDDLCLKISQFSDRAAAASLSKFRNATNYLTFSESQDGKSKLVADYLSWDELVHTSYFRVPEFTKMVACAVSEVDGFAPKPALRSDSSYSAAADWLKEATRAT